MTLITVVAGTIQVLDSAKKQTRNTPRGSRQAAFPAAAIMGGDGNGRGPIRPRPEVKSLPAGIGSFRFAEGVAWAAFGAPAI